MEGFLRFIENIASQGSFDAVRPVYRITGSESLAEQAAPALGGYRGLGPVRIGNDAVGQLQHDVYGSIVLAATQLFYDERLSARGDAALFARLETLGSAAVRAYGQPDAGPWEFRTTVRPHTFSAMMCWAACDRLAHVALSLGLESRAGEWRAHATRMRADLLQRAWSEAANSFVSTLDGAATLDATALLMPELGLIAPTDPRFAATVAAIERELVNGGYVMRYRHPDDFGTPENAFTVCTFWYVNALDLLGRHDEAVRHFEAVLARRNHVGLLSEDIDPATGELWGNFPQTYSLVGIIRSAVRLSRPWEAAL
jgi:GH15 family glucan-1,4-alpha-glucosidase